MSEEANLLRLLVQADKEYKITPVTVTATATKFTSALTLGYARRGIAAYNNSDEASGECYWGNAGVVSGTGMPIVKGAISEMPVAANLDIYFASETGEIGDLRVIEIS